MDHLSVVPADSQELEKQLRIASISIALWDYIITLPAEWRFYRSQSSIWRLSPGCVLFILIRYISVLVMVISNYGVLSTSFTEETCQRYYIVAPIFKVIQTMISQGILGFRTFQITKRNRRVGIALVSLYFVTILLEWFTNMFHRIPVVVNGTCIPGNSGKALSAYFYYITATLYDFSVLTISSVCLLRYDTLSKRLGRRLRSLVYDGIGYFIVLTGMNVFNIIFYHTANVQTQAEGASVGYAVTWIMSQRLLISRLRKEMSTTECQPLENVVFARPAYPSHTVITSCSQFDSKGHADVDIAPTLPRNAHNDDVELDIRVCVDRSMVVDYMNESEHRRWGMMNTAGM